MYLCGKLRQIMNVHIRERKGKNPDIINLYLEIYKGYTKKANGKTKANRERKKLDYFLYTKPKTPSQKSHNKDVKRKIEAIRGQTLNELLNKKYGFKSETNGRINFIEYFDKLTQERYKSKGNYGNWDSVLKHLKNYAGDNISFDSIDVKFCEGFKDYLENMAKTKSAKSLSSNSVSSYFGKFRASLNQAVDDDIMIQNPARKVSIPKVIESERVFLTIEEVKKLFNTECRYDVLKRAFLFSCITGLRWSDVQKLEWSQFQKDGKNWKIVFHQKKTKELQYHILNKKAIELIGKPIEGHERVFVGLRYSSYMNVALAKWMLQAGITKHVTFHSARHTFATMLLTKGVEIYTVSKLLGHSEIRTTQIYGKIIDQKKIEAVESIDIFD